MRKRTFLLFLLLIIFSLPKNSVFSKPLIETSKETVSENALNTKELNWYFQIRNDNKPPEGPKESASFVNKYDAFYLGDTSEKVIYLTFDEGYENGYTGKILDILKKHNAKAAFFVVRPYIDTEKELVKRMVDEGHLVCNHTVHHPSMAQVQDINKFNSEFKGVEDSFKCLTGQDMPKFFRPPMGKYSELSLKRTQDLGYTTIFWSFAYHDWDPKNQPSHEKAMTTIKNRTHNGAIFLLHAVSKTNTEILDDVLTYWEKEGYVIKPLTELKK